MNLPNDDRVNFKCKSTDKAAWKQAAEESGRSLSNWIIWTLNLAADQSSKATEKKSE